MSLPIATLLQEGPPFFLTDSSMLDAKNGKELYLFSFIIRVIVKILPELSKIQSVNLVYLVHISPAFIAASILSLENISPISSEPVQSLSFNTTSFFDSDTNAQVVNALLNWLNIFSICLLSINSVTSVILDIPKAS